jgi:hypothetical protein
MTDLATIILGVATGLVANGVFELTKAIRRRFVDNGLSKKIRLVVDEKAIVVPSGHTFSKKISIPRATALKKLLTVGHDRLLKITEAVGLGFFLTSPVDYAIFPRQLLFSPTSKTKCLSPNLGLAFLIPIFIPIGQ